MTVMGKILVFVILVLAVVQAGLFIMFHVAQANWVVSFNKLKDQYKATEAEMETYKVEAGEARTQRDAEVAKVNKDLEVVAKKLQDKETELDARVKELQLAKQQGTNTNAALVGTEGGIQRRQTENQSLDAALKERETRINDLVKSNNDLRDRAVKAEIEAKSVNERNSNLVTQVEDLGKQLARAKSIGGGAAGNGATEAMAKNPPVEDVQGVVMKTDPSGLMTLSIGSDSGVQKGHTLEVFRLNPPKYLGTIRIMESRPNEAVGKPVSRPMGTIVPGDLVASKILGS